MNTIENLLKHKIITVSGYSDDEYKIYDIDKKYSVFVICNNIVQQVESLTSTQDNDPDYVGVVLPTGDDWDEHFNNLAVIKNENIYKNSEFLS